MNKLYVCANREGQFSGRNNCILKIEPQCYCICHDVAQTRYFNLGTAFPFWWSGFYYLVTTIYQACRYSVLYLDSSVNNLGRYFRINVHNSKCVSLAHY
jgi:hypothetical protein